MSVNKHGNEFVIRGGRESLYIHQRNSGSTELPTLQNQRSLSRYAMYVSGSFNSGCTIELPGGVFSKHECWMLTKTTSIRIFRGGAQKQVVLKGSSKTIVCSPWLQPDYGTMRSRMPRWQIAPPQGRELTSLVFDLGTGL